MLSRAVELKFGINLSSCLLDFFKFVDLVLFSFDHKLVDGESELLKHVIVQLCSLDSLCELNTLVWNGSREFLHLLLDRTGFQ